MSERKKALGCALVCVGIIANLIALGAFTATEPLPWWMEPIAAICFWGWWIFVLVGILLISTSLYLHGQARITIADPQSREALPESHPLSVRR